MDPIGTGTTREILKAWLRKFCLIIHLPLHIFCLCMGIARLGAPFTYIYLTYYSLFVIYLMNQRMRHEVVEPRSENFMITKKVFIYAFIYFWEYFFDSLDTLFWYPVSAVSVIIRWSLRIISRIDMNRYYKEHCMDSGYPDQIRYKRSTWYYSKNEPLRITCSGKRKDKNIDFEAVVNPVAERFIQLLPSITLGQFSKTSKSIYFQCIDNRGLEFSYFHWKNASGPCPEVSVAKNGRFIGTSDFTSEHPELERFVICRDTLRCPGIGGIPFYKTYAQLILIFEFNDFNSEYETALQNLLHDGVNFVKLFVHGMANMPDVSLPTLSNFMNFLKNCHKVTKIGVCFHQVHYLNFNLILGIPVMLRETPDILQIKICLENWLNSRPDLNFFKFIYNHNGFMLHEQRLKLMQKFMIRSWFLTDDFGGLDKVDTKHGQTNFLDELESPYYFEPHLFHEYVI